MDAQSSGVRIGSVTARPWADSASSASFQRRESTRFWIWELIDAPFAHERVILDDRTSRRVESIRVFLPNCERGGYTPQSRGRFLTQSTQDHKEEERGDRNGVCAGCEDIGCAGGNNSGVSGGGEGGGASECGWAIPCDR